MQLLNREEVEGVLAHELSHIYNRDILIGTVASVLAGVIMMLADMARWAALFGGFSRDDREEGTGGLEVIVLAILAPIAALIIQMAISRSREYLADATGARFAGTPCGLASALKKLGIASQRMPLQASTATAHMFIVNPLSARSFMALFSTHPPLEERIKRLTGGQAVL
jgi:heat shock protein HtpX